MNSASDAWIALLGLLNSAATTLTQSLGTEGLLLGILAGCAALIYPSRGQATNHGWWIRFGVVLRRAITAAILAWMVLLSVSQFNQAMAPAPQVADAAPDPPIVDTMSNQGDSLPVPRSAGDIAKLAAASSPQKISPGILPTFALFPIFAIVVSALLLFATKITYDNITDVRRLKEEAEERKEKDKEDVQHDRREIGRIRRRMELVEYRFELLTRVGYGGLSEQQHGKFQAVYYIRDVYKDPTRIECAADLGLDGLLESERLRRALAPEDWNYLEWMSDSFRHSDPGMQQDVRTAASRVYAKRPE